MDNNVSYLMIIQSAPVSLLPLHFCVVVVAFGFDFVFVSSPFTVLQHINNKMHTHAHGHTNVQRAKKRNNIENNRRVRETENVNRV